MKALGHASILSLCHFSAVPCVTQQWLGCWITHSLFFLQMASCRLCTWHQCSWKSRQSVPTERQMGTFSICQWHIHIGRTLTTFVFSSCAIDCTEQINKGMHALFEWDVLVSLIRLSNPAWVCIRKLIFLLYFNALMQTTDWLLNACNAFTLKYFFAFKYRSSPQSQWAGWTCLGTQWVVSGVIHLGGSSEE